MTKAEKMFRELYDKAMDKTNRYYFGKSRTDEALKEMEEAEYECGSFCMTVVKMMTERDPDIFNKFFT